MAGSVNWGRVLLKKNKKNMQVVVMLPDRIQPVPCSLKEQGGTASASPRRHPSAFFPFIEVNDSQLSHKVYLFAWSMEHKFCSNSMFISNKKMPFCWDFKFVRLWNKTHLKFLKNFFEFD